MGRAPHGVLWVGSVRSWRHFGFTGGLLEVLTAFFVSKLLLCGCVWMRCTNKYKVSEEFWSAVLLSREGSSRRQAKRKKGVKVDLLNNYHLVVLNFGTWHLLWLTINYVSQVESVLPVISLSLSWPTSFFVVFSLPVLLRRGSNRGAWWVHSCQPSSIH